VEKLSSIDFEFVAGKYSSADGDQNTGSTPPPQSNDPEKWYIG